MMNQQLNDQTININAVRRAVVSQAFEEGVGRRAFVMTPEYPYVFIGEIKQVNSDYVLILAESTNITALDGYLFRIHIDDIEVFFIEDREHTIPRIR